MICRRGVKFPAPTHRPRLKDAAQAKASGPGAGHLHTLAAGAGRPLAFLQSLAPLIWRLRRVAYAAGRSRPPCRWGDPFRAVAQRPARIRWTIRFYPPGVRSAPPATAGSRVPAARSAFALRGEPPRLWLSSLLLSRSSPPCLAHNALRWQSARCRWPDPWPRRPARLGGRSRHARKPRRCHSRRAIGQKRSRPPGRPLQVRLRQPPSTAERHDLAPPHCPHVLVPVHVARPLDALPVRLPIRAAPQRNGQGRSGSSNRSARLAGLRSAFAP